MFWLKAKHRRCCSESKQTGESPGHLDDATPAAVWRHVVLMFESMSTIRPEPPSMSSRWVK